MRSITTILDIQSTRRSREAVFSLAQAKRDLAVPTLQQAVESVQTAMSHTQASRLTFLPFWAHQQDQMYLSCHRAFLCASPQRSVPPSTPFCHSGETASECCGTPHPQEEPHTSALKHVLQESRATGKQQLLLGDSGNLRKHLMKSAKRKEPGDQREPYKVYLLVLLNQEAGFALRLFTWH